MGQTKEKLEKIVAFTFCGEEHDVDSGKDSLKLICAFMYQKDKATFNTLPEQIRYRDKHWFSHDKVGFHRPHRFLGTTIYLDTNLKTADIKKIAYDVIKLFGFKRSDLTFRSVFSSKV